MITWNCKPAFTGALLLLLGACGDGQSLGFLDGSTLSAPDDQNVALSRAKMANGAFTLVAPEGYCIDQHSLKQRFALMARCDALGAATHNAGAPLGLITVSVARARDNHTLPDAPTMADAAKLARVSNSALESGSVTFKAEGAPPAAGLDVTHWRGVTRIEKQMVGINVYGPKNGRALSEEGRSMISETIRRTVAGS